ncbi:hypothetical protein PILCRDRAFT_527373 [Piloderma croceum F 1598]|uniref:Uncharacterized protein n=1 Tax=Piloderma croceum (strain F 1598) TaxID=765440 RepID=A0A0C3FLP3_PILCF|nr:hypothetical protein PILCRDRAFT_527373 [Piloderma croceum F 1598]
MAADVSVLTEREIHKISTYVVHSITGNRLKQQENRGRHSDANIAAIVTVSNATAEAAKTIVDLRVQCGLEFSAGPPAPT